MSKKYLDFKDSQAEEILDLREKIKQCNLARISLIQINVALLKENEQLRSQLTKLLYPELAANPPWEREKK